MTSNDEPKESFEDFKNSFSYGSRTDLNFKFLKALPEEDAAKFFQDLLWKLGDSFNDGDFGRLVEHVYQWQIRAYANKGAWTYDTGPLTLPQKPISESRLALITSTGHFVEGDDPEPFGVKNMTQEEAITRIDDFVKAAPILSSIPVDTPKAKLKVRHAGFDIRGVQLDPNVALPIERLRELEKEGIIGKLASPAYSFMGATAQTPLIKKVGPQWVDMLKKQQVDVALLVPVWPVCHVSVGHVARLLEEAGIPTVIIAIRAFRPRMEAMTLPRLLLTPHLMGRPLGPPGDYERQRATILAALALFESATEAGTIAELEGVYHPTGHVPDTTIT